eukprot:1644833-Rhodomonas_salina.1
MSLFGPHRPDVTRHLSRGQSVWARRLPNAPRHHPSRPDLEQRRMLPIKPPLGWYCGWGLKERHAADLEVFDGLPLVLHLAHQRLCPILAPETTRARDLRDTATLSSRHDPLIHET